MELLLLLVENRDRLVTREEITERLWKGEVYVDTEHGINTAIRKIRAVLRDDPEKPRFLQTVTGMGYRFVARVEVEGPLTVQAPVEAPLEQTPNAQATWLTAKNRLWLAGGLSVVALGAVALLLAGPRLFHRGQTAIGSIAVLPLDNLSGDPNQDYFAAGMTDELITMLARDSTLRVTSRTSVMQYKSVHRPLKEIAKALNVDAIVEGSVERTGDHVHVTLQLIRADTDTHLWADSYDRNNNDTSTLPDEAARAIAERLNHAAAGVARVRSINPEAHDDYLRGQYLWMVGRNEEAGQYFQKAVEIQPDYAAGWAGLSEYLDLKAMSGEGKTLELLTEAEAAANRAVELDDSLVLGHICVGAAVLFGHWDTAKALKELDRAIELDPQNSQALHLKAKILCAMDRFDDANAVQAKSTAANAFVHPGARAEIFNCTRQFGSAIQDAQLRLRDFPTSGDVLGELAESYHWTGHDKEAVESLARMFASEGKPELSEAARAAFGKGGYRAVVQSELIYFERIARTTGFSPVELSRFHAMLGDKNEAIRLLQVAADAHAPLLVFRLNDPAYDALHNDPRFRAVAQRVGLPYEGKPTATN